MATTLMHRTAHDSIGLTRVRSALRDAVTRRAPEPAVNEGRWATLPGEYAGPWGAPATSTLPPIVAPGVTAAVAGGRCGPVIVHLAGDWAGHILFEGSTDGTTWTSLPLAPLAGGGTAAEANRPGLWRTLPGERARFIRLRALVMRRGALHLSIAAAPAMARSAAGALDSAA